MSLSGERKERSFPKNPAKLIQVTYTHTDNYSVPRTRDDLYVIGWPNRISTIEYINKILRERHPIDHIDEVYYTS